MIILLKKYKIDLPETAGNGNLLFLCTNLRHCNNIRYYNNQYFFRNQAGLIAAISLLTPVPFTYNILTEKRDRKSLSPGASSPLTFSINADIKLKRKIL
jgi:hypothetical protein